MSDYYYSAPDPDAKPWPEGWPAWQRVVLLLTLSTHAAVFGTGVWALIEGDLRWPSKPEPDAFRILASDDLEPLQPVIDDASEELGFEIEMAFPGGTIDCSGALASPGAMDTKFNATWFDTNRYAHLRYTMDTPMAGTSIASSPVVLGVRTEKARELGWTESPPTWAEIAEAAGAGKFRYAMSDPAKSDTGAATMAAVATSLADTGNALRRADIDAHAPEMQGFLGGRAFVAGSSAELADGFRARPGDVDGLFDHEWALKSMIDEGEDLTVVIPSDGVIVADYPLSLHSGFGEVQEEQLEALVGWLEDHPDRLEALHMRPSAAGGSSTGKPDEVLIEMPYPGDIEIITKLNSIQDDGRGSPSTCK